MSTLDFFASLAIATLTGLGVGSGGLLVVYLTLVTHAQQLWAQGINLAFFVLAALSSFAVNLKKRRIPPHTLVFVLTFGMIGVCVGTVLLPYVSPRIIRKIFGGMLILLSLLTFFEEKIKKLLRKVKNKNNF